jgi:hypothetical protein
MYVCVCLFVRVSVLGVTYVRTFFSSPAAHLRRITRYVRRLTRERSEIQRAVEAARNPEARQAYRASILVEAYLPFDAELLYF